MKDFWLIFCIETLKNFRINHNIVQYLYCIFISTWHKLRFKCPLQFYIELVKESDVHKQTPAASYNQSGGTSFTLGTTRY